MTKTIFHPHKSALLFGAAPLAMLVAMTATPAVAQSASAGADQAAAAQTGVPSAQVDSSSDKAQNNDIVVTGSLFRRTNTETPSPVSVLTADDLQKRGLQTVQAAIQSISSNNGPALTNSFTANGAFAGGASAVSLRGLTTDSTLVLFDGLRAAYYPLADDGVRNFVDLNTIPDEIVERIDILKDGASSTYGADAVAGVVNIITKKQVTGIHLTAESGVTERGDGGNHRLTGTVGYGDLSQDRFNVYVSAHYVDSSPIYNSDRGYPYNTANLQGVCYQGVCGPNNILNGATNGVYNGLSATNAFLVRPYTQTSAGVTQPVLGTSLGRYQLLNGCQGLTPYTLSDADYAANATAPRTVCQQDDVAKYQQLEPLERRGGVSGHVTVKLGDRSEFTTELNYENNYTSYTGFPSTIVGSLPPGIDFPSFSTSATATHAAGSGVLVLPVFICPRGTTVACTAANGTLNPNNPFASQGEVARVVGTLPTSITSNSTKSQVFRAAASLHGGFGDNWTYSLDGTAMISKLETRANGYVFAQHLLDEVADGSYNFVNPSQTSAANLAYLTPTQVNEDSSHLYQVQGNVGKELFQLPGGPLQVAVGGAFRHESLNDPSGNPDYNGPTNRYFTLNAFGAVGSRDVESAYFEINAPIVTQLEIDGSGRYDHYSTGQSNFSPKIGAKFTPIPQLALRGTFSRGFRIPSFAESNSLPTTGYVTVSAAALPASFSAGHLTATGGFDPYLTAYSVGETTVGNPNLKPEKSRNFTAGAILEPIKRVSFTVDYYNIRKTNAITTVNFASALTNYYLTGQTTFGGVTIIPDAPDTTGVQPGNAASRPRVAFAQGSFINATTIETSGIDFGVRASFPITDTIKFTTSGEATYIFYLNTEFPDGHTEHYAGTLGNFNLTAGSGTQRWKANWQNTLAFGAASLTATAYYTSGYNYSAEDQGSVAGDCSLVPTNNDGNAYQPCNVKGVVFVDMHGEVKVAPRFTVYMDILNVADTKPPIDATTYGAYLYNPVVGDEGIIGRSFRVGAKVDF